MRAIDSNVLIRLLARDEPRQVALAERFVSSGAWVSHLVLMETVWVLDSVYGVRPADIASAIEMLLAHEHLVLQDPDAVAGAVSHYRSRPSLGFSDCLILAVARKAGHLPLGTFDRTLSKLEGAERL